MRRNADTYFLIALTSGATILAAVLYFAGAATWLEAVAFVTGAVCVWLTVRENIWNFPLGLANVVASAFVCFNVGLFADAGLQIVYFVLGIIGWYLWLHGGAHRTALRVGRARRTELLCVAFSGVLLTVLLWQLLRHAGGSASFWDALTTSLSLCAQWLLNRKRLENWYCWIVVDVVYIPLYLYKNLILMAVLYAIFLAMATIGLLKWRINWREQQSLPGGFPIIPMPAQTPAAALEPAS
jgi:nicotinamide mononucleotide transporter